MSAVPASDRSVPASHNGDAVTRSADTLATLNRFLADNPAIQSEPIALEAARLKKQGKAAHDDMEAERDSRVRPLNDEVKAINGSYAGPKAVLQKVRDDLDRRLTDFSRAEERRRAAEAAEKRRQAEEAERLAREAEAREREAQEAVSDGVVGVDIASTTTAADEAFREHEKASRVAARAERDATVRLGTGFGRAVALRSKETLTVTDAAAALRAIGLTPKIEEAILSGAREFRREWDELPPGITATVERTL